ncbi:MAG: hypothetical protein ABL907_23260 [Hyphomicrobium sp.]
MTISDDLFRAILAMDACNRGDTPGIAGLGGQGTQIGNATISRQSNTPEQAAASFSATAYTWNNHQIISYRGTDNYLQDPTLGWTAGVLATPFVAHAFMAAQFYQAVVGNATTFKDKPAKIAMTDAEGQSSVALLQDVISRATDFDTVARAG